MRTAVRTGARPVPSGRKEKAETWYPALHREGISDGPSADARGAFHPYLVRHWGVTVMLHAERPEGGSYSRHQVAKQFGHIVQTLDRVYAEVPDDLHGIAGRTMDEIMRGVSEKVTQPGSREPSLGGRLLA